MGSAIRRHKVFVVGSVAAVGGAVLLWQKRRGHESHIATTTTD